MNKKRFIPGEKEKLLREIERLRAEKSEEHYRDLFENATDLIQSANLEGGIIYANGAWKKALGYSDSEVKKVNIFNIIHSEYKSYCKDIVQRLIRGGEVDKFEIAFVTKTNKTIFVEGNVSLKTKDGKPHSTRGIFRNITDRKITEEKTKQSLKEKEVLLKEVHHRVKNNLQVISSILNLQSSYVKDKKILEVLKESQNRIKSMAFIHESLYQAKDFSSINFSEYISNLSRNLVHSYRSEERRVGKECRL